MTTFPPDWVLLEAAKRSNKTPDVMGLRSMYETSDVFSALCEALLEPALEQPVDRKLLCAREAMAQSLGGDRFGVPQRILKGKCDDMSGMDTCIRAIELWESGYGK